MRQGCVLRHHDLSHHELKLVRVFPITGVVLEAPAQTDNGRKTCLAHYVFDCLRGPQHGRCQSWFRLRNLTHGVCPLLLISTRLVSLYFKLDGWLSETGQSKQTSFEL